MCNAAVSGMHGGVYLNMSRLFSQASILCKWLTLSAYVQEIHKKKQELEVARYLGGIVSADEVSMWASCIRLKSILLY